MTEPVAIVRKPPWYIRDDVPWLVWVAWSLVIVGASVAYAWKAADSRSAFVRWRHQVLEIRDGVNIWDRYYFPNPPILPILLFPLMVMPAVVGALLWYALKGVMVTWSIFALIRMARGRGGPPLHSWGIFLIMLLVLRPVLSDLQHGNINILILFLIVLTLLAWQRGRDVWAGLSLALAIATKVTPGLLLVYFVYKRSWKSVGACLVGLLLFFLVIPSAVLGPQFNWACLMEWRQNIISPFVQGEVILSTQEVNQSMVAVVTRLMTQTSAIGPHGNNGTELDLNLLSLDPELVAKVAKGCALALVALLALLCRTRASRRDDPRLLGEFALVVLTMLFVSERSWKHHFVTLLLPLTYLVYRLFEAHTRRAARTIYATGLGLFALMMLSTSHEVGRNFASGQGHDIALYYGLFFWASSALYMLTAWRVVAERSEIGRIGEVTPLPNPHFVKKPLGRTVD